MTTYKLVWDGSVIKDGAGVILNLSNSPAWQEYLAWLAVPGNVPAAADPEPLAPYQVRRVAAKIGVITIQNWPTYTPAQLQTWWDNNLADSIVDGFAIPAGVKTMLKAQNLAILSIGKLLIYLRDWVMIINGNS